MFVMSDFRQIIREFPLRPLRTEADLDRACTKGEILAEVARMKGVMRAMSDQGEGVRSGILRPHGSAGSPRTRR